MLGDGVPGGVDPPCRTRVSDWTTVPSGRVFWLKRFASSPNSVVVVAPATLLV